MENYEVLNLIGKGNFGAISKIIRKTDNKILVWKELDYGRMSEKEKQNIVSEVNILRDLRHPNIVKYEDRIIDKKNTKIYIIMEFCEGGDIGQLIKRLKKTKEHIPEEVVWKILTQLVLALHECHNHKEGKILHRDIKPSNVFLDGENNVKLGDFGLSRILSNESVFAYSHVGTPYYMSPEQIEEVRYNDKSDIWSLGCFLYELTTFCPPFEATNQLSLALKIKAGKVESIPSKYTDELNKVIMWLLNVDHMKRPSIDELLNLPQIVLRIRERKLKENYMKMKKMEEVIKEKENNLVTKENDINEKERVVLNKEKNLITLEEKLKSKEQELIDRENKLNLDTINNQLPSNKQFNEITIAPLHIQFQINPSSRFIDNNNKAQSLIQQEEKDTKKVNEINQFEQLFSFYSEQQQQIQSRPLAIPIPQPHPQQHVQSQPQLFRQSQLQHSNIIKKSYNNFNTNNTQIPKQNINHHDLYSKYETYNPSNHTNNRNFSQTDQLNSYLTDDKINYPPNQAINLSTTVSSIPTTNSFTQKKPLAKYAPSNPSSMNSVKNSIQKSVTIKKTMSVKLPTK